VNPRYHRSDIDMTMDSIAARHLPELGDDAEGDDERNGLT
jgi:hypothetical protein